LPHLSGGFPGCCFAREADARRLEDSVGGCHPMSEGSRALGLSRWE
jgi:hypothetical protein